ncbi:MAG TPA: NAD(P)H-dependent oxidoreductase [Flavisolibacter sp.]|jgi:putative NADPH-quinone reductase|nr:NAD(P)H-dependent oxidoreductase [Flavisolibacter sp.]
MKNVLVVVGHPRLSRSNANRIIVENLIDLPRVTVCDLVSNYPDGEFDVEVEQKRLCENDLIILQFPFIWYSMPYHLKAWIEKVFSYGFAFGPGGDKLKNKKLLASVTLGGNQDAYSVQGQHQHPVEAFLLPLKQFASYCGMQYLPPVYSYEMASIPGEAVDGIRDKAILHAHRLRWVIESSTKVSPVSAVHR